MSSSTETNESSRHLDKIKATKRKHEAKLLKRRNVVGIGIGYKEVGGQKTDQLSLVIMVKEKIPAERLGPKDCIPSEIEGVPTDVKEVGVIRALN
ncbi:MAG: hypothetical protein GTO12_18740 [Proteobacteria bacterium]|nr:hypothetical protein [Pseudomonadota bacterium]